MGQVIPYKLRDGALRAYGRTPIVVESFALGVTRPTALNAGVPGTRTLRSAAQLGLPTEPNGDVIITDAYHAANKTGGVLTITGLDLFGFVKVRTGLPVEINESRVRGSGPASTRTGLIDCNHPDVGSLGLQNVVVSRSTLIPDFPSQWIDGIVGHDYRLSRVLIRECVDHFGWFNSYRPADPVRVTVEGCYADNLAYFSPCSYQPDNRTHNGCGEGQGGHGVRIFGNDLRANVSPTSGNGSDPADPTAPAKNPWVPSVTGQCIGVAPNVSAMRDILIEGNWLDYGAQTITAIDNNYPVSDLRILRNRFGQNQPRRLRNGVTARRAIVLEPGVGAPGMPASTGLDLTNGNVWDVDGPEGSAGSPVTVWRYEE